MPEMPAPMINTSTCSMLVEFMLFLFGSAPHELRCRRLVLTHCPAAPGPWS
jgi:hypothetical protein